MQWHEPCKTSAWFERICGSELRGEIVMTLIKISRREFLEGVGAGAIVAGTGARVAFAADITLGIVYVGPRDDFGWNQAHAVAVKSLKTLKGIKAVEE
jgi:basic membrane protein A